MNRITMLVAAAAAVAVLLPTSSALATPGTDYRAVFRDWKPDRVITACRFTRTQLVNARKVAATVTDFNSYAPGFRENVRREIARHDAGGCSRARARSALRNVRITRIRPRGGLGESVTIRNTGARAVSLKGATLRDRGGRRLRLGGAGKLAGRRSLRVVTGCARGRRRPARIGSSLFACRSRRLWDDRGDLVKVVDSRGTVVARRGYGTLRGAIRF
ncbi:MAG: lamin tail domain-containing protein [Thermoleophilaceae bacterium]